MKATTVTFAALCAAFVVAALTSAGESYFSGDTSAITGSNNLFFGAGGSVPGTLVGTVTGDPLLVSPSTHDFHLQAGSAAIDHGIATPALTDYDGDPRPQGAAFDIGAYERTR
jgi:hypothetical protein